MEHMGKALQSLATAGASRELDVRRKNLELRQVPELMEQMKANYPGQELPAETSEIWMAGWVEMVREFGLQEFRQALVPLLVRSIFYPHPAEIYAVLKSRQAEQRRTAAEEEHRRRVAADQAEFLRYLEDRKRATGETDEQVLCRFPGRASK